MLAVSLGALCLAISVGPATAQPSGIVRQTETATLGSSQTRLPKIVDVSRYLEEARLLLSRMPQPAGTGAAARQSRGYQVGDRDKFWAIDFAQGRISS